MVIFASQHPRFSSSFTRLTIALLFTACGGGSTNTPSGSTPASITIQAGNNQQASSRTGVATAPTVLVKDADGNVVVGATVQFTIAAGEGRVDGASPKTDASGIARVGSWILGNIGAQRLSAKVGSLDAVSFDATITPGTETMVATVPTTGGTVEITTPGHPYHGTKLTIPAGSFPVAKEWILRVDPNITLPNVPTGFTVLGPALMVETAALRSSNLMTLTMPVPAGSTASLVLYDPVRRVLEVMPTVARTATSITVMTGHLNPALLLGPNTAGSGFANIAAPGAGVFIVGMPTFYPLLPTFENGLPRWPLPDAATTAFPNGHGAAIPGINAILNNLSSAAGGLIKGSIPSNYHTDVASFGTLEIVASRLANSTQDPLGEYLAALAPVPKADRDLWTAGQLNVYLGLAGLPIPVGLYKDANAPYLQGAYVTAIGTTATSIQFVNAADHSTTELRLSVFGFAEPQVKRLPAEAPFTATVAVPMSSFIVPWETVVPDVGRMIQSLTAIGQAKVTLNQTIAQMALLPAGAFEYQATPDGPWIPGDNLIVFRNTTGKLRPVINGIPQPMLIIDPKTLVETTHTSGGAINYADLPYFNENGAQKIVSSLVQALTGGERQVLPLSIDFAKELFVISPEKIKITPADRKTDFTASVGRPPSEGFRIKWEWGDGTPATENLGLTTASHTYALANNYQVIATLTRNNQARTVLAVDTAQVEVDPQPFWRILTLSDPNELLNHVDNGTDELSLALYRIIQNPAAGLISIEQNGGGTELRVRAKQNGVWSANDCCPMLGYNPATERLIPLGFAPAVSHPVGPFFAGWGTSFWNQTTQELNSGTLTGQYVPRVMQYQIHDQGTQTGPAGGFRFSATRNGNMMTGEIIVHVWFVDRDTGEVSEMKVSHLPFTAVRMQ